MGINIIFLLIILQIMYRLGNARPIPFQHALNPLQIERSNFTNNVPIERSNSTNNVPIERSNAPKNGSMDATRLIQTVANYSIMHIPRKKRQSSRSKDIHVVHEPCELDLNTVSNLKVPSNCVVAYTNRFAMEKFYKEYRLYQLEAFSFGQHFERFRRFETEQHTFEYRGTGLLS